MTDFDFVYAALKTPLSITCIILLLLLTPAALLGIRALVVIGRADRRRDLLRDTDGTATIEFALVLPILLFVILALAQTTMLMGGNLFVHYAATAAARSAIVQIPYDYLDEPANNYYGSPGTPKYDAIQRSAAFALMPVASGPPDSAGASTASAGFVDGLNQFYAAYGAQTPVWVTNLAAQRLEYALQTTHISLFRPTVQPNNTVYFEPLEGAIVEPKDPIRVRVEHELNLGVPYANRLFDDGEQPDGVGRYCLIVATATLTNEGILDEMPPLPAIPRQPLP
ncbi:pilus assembly protein [Planctomycetales bacterium ZRK34]|nr:pilus assembly protein [Planctomycetales bacterium ZRK34]